MSKVMTVYPNMCDQQKRDIEQILLAADEIGAAATAVAHGGHGYSMLLDARDNFRNMVTQMATHYCLVEEK